MKCSSFLDQANSSHLNVPVSVSQAVKAQLVRDLCRVHCIWQILLVGEDQQNLKKENKLSLVVEEENLNVHCSHRLP